MTTPLREVDTAWLHMGGETNRMVIDAALFLDGPLERAALAGLIESRLLRHERFVRRVREGTRPVWERDPHFHLDNHLSHVALPAPADEAALRDRLSQELSTPLDPARPLWRVTMLDGHGAGTILHARIHHCIADGVALVKVLLGLTDELADVQPAVVGVDDPHLTGVARLRALAGRATALGETLLLSSDPTDWPLKGPLGVRKRVAWSSATSLDRLRDAGRAQGGTLNDVVLAAAAGSLRRYLLARGVAPRALRALVPVFLKTGSSEADALGNHFGLVFVELPVDLATPSERLAAVRGRMAAIKASQEPAMAVDVLSLMGAVPSAVEQIGVDLFTAKATVMMTNVPGPPVAVHLAGREVESMLVWAPSGGTIGLSLSVLSYAGAVRVGVRSDGAVIPDPEALVAGFEDELRGLLGGTGTAHASSPA